jgi:energy coupling factor transporter S component ThiW
MVRKIDHTRALALDAMLAAIAVILSIIPGSIPIGPTKVLPYQHMVNVIAGVVLGPWHAVLMATIAAVIRNALGVGTLFAFPGGIPGGLVVGLIHKYAVKRDEAGLTEPLGTFIGALISAWIVAPSLGVAFKPAFGITEQWALFSVFFLLSSVPGAIMGYVILKALKARRVL